MHRRDQPRQRQVLGEIPRRTRLDRSQEVLGGLTCSQQHDLRLRARLHDRAHDFEP